MVGNLIELVWLKQAYRRPHFIGIWLKTQSGVVFMPSNAIELVLDDVHFLSVCCLPWIAPTAVS